MPAQVWIVAAAAVAFAALVTFGRGWWRVRWVLDWLRVLDVRRWWYSWQRAAHVIEQAQAGPVLAPDFWGSMDYEAERELFWPAPARYEVTHEGGPDWREQTAADLAPEALEPPCNHEYTPNLAGTHEWCRKCDSVRVIDDPGPGDLPSLDPGPDQFRMSWLDWQLKDHLDWARMMRAQVTGWSLA